MKKLITVRAEPDVRETIKAIGRSEYYKAAVELMEKSKQLGLVPENLVSPPIVKKDDSKDLVKKLLGDNERLEKELAKARKEAEDNLLASDDERLVSARVEFRKLRDRLIKYEEMYGSI